MLASALHATILQYPDRVALDHKGKQITYQELWGHSIYLAGILKEYGVKPNCNVVILGENSIATVIAWWAVTMCDAVCVYLNEQLKQSGLAYITTDCTPSLFVCGTNKIAATIPDQYDSIVLEDIDWTACVENKRNPSPPMPARLNSISSIVYTSGSTGLPKGVCLTHKNLLSSARISVNGHGLSENDRYLMVVPLHYVHGLMMLLSTLLSGGSVEFMNSFMFPSVIVKKIQEKNITGISGVPYHFSALMDRSNFLTTDLPQLRWVCVTGGAISTARLHRLVDSKPDIDVHIGYGQTECSPRISRLDPRKISTKPRSIGSIEPGLTLQLLDPNGVEVSMGETGEMVISGDSVMHGYWNDSAGTAKVIDKQGRLHTGDMGYIDEDGDIFIRGRVQAMIKTAGERIFPEELENILSQHVAVSEVAVVGREDDLYGQVVIAHIIINAQDRLCTDEVVKQIESFCLEHVPYARAPRQFEVWQQFPLMANGKIDKQRLIASADDSAIAKTAYR